jgi:DNA modification methylase
MTGQTWKGDNWTLTNGDSCEEMTKLADESVDLSVYSPPFLSLYVYSASERDIGNCASADEFLEHMGYVIREMLRVTKPGRHTCVHVAEVTSTKQMHGVIGLIDLPGMMIRAYTEAGWIYHGRVTIDKDPQAQAIRTKSKSLLFVQLRKDSSWSRPALADYILIFRKPGENAVPVQPDITNEDWIQWARPIWYGIRESDTLNTAVAKENDDERHICPLQLGTIERCIRLWSNEGETVLSPFGGIGSEGYEAVRLNRKYIGIELKPSYAATAVKNLQAAESLKSQGSLFAEVPREAAEPV